MRTNEVKRSRGQQFESALGRFFSSKNHLYGTNWAYPKVSNMKQKAIIYHFSGTGNSLSIAKKIAEKLDAKLLSVAAQKDKPLEQAEITGIVFPVYCWGLPSIVANFSKQLKSDSYYFGVATFGGMVGNSIIQLKDILKSNKQVLSAGFGIRMPGNYFPLYGAKPLEKQKKMFDKAEEAVLDIVKIVQQKKISKLSKSNFLVNSLLGKFLYKKMMKNMKAADKNFWVDDNCNGCGTCAELCPVNNLTLKDKKPVWGHGCEQCMACLQWCPKQAIQFKQIKERKRYHNPDIALKEMLLR